ncbi:MAG TPA: DUF4340 domain-containing protein [Hyphomicrobiaceae bacterium]|nr:DUF4340 domain-containing protein [Hyphomicrobiaceae bacterium]
MIKPQVFAGLVAAAVASLAVAVPLHTFYDRWTLPKATGELLVPDLASKFKDIQAVEIVHQGKTLTLTRSGNIWGAKERSGYPVGIDRIAELLKKVALAELVEAKTKSKDRLAILELEDPAGPKANSKRVRIKSAKDEVLADVVIGKSKLGAFGGAPGTYVRRINETQAWLASGDPRPSADLKDWVPTAFLEQDTSKIAKVSIEIKGEPPLKLERAATPGAKLTMVDAPAGKKMKEGQTIDAIGAALASLDLEDVRAVNPGPIAPGTHIVRFEEKDGIAVTLHFRPEGDAHWVAVEATGTTDAAKKTAEAIMTRTRGWEYKLGKYKTDQILKRRTDLFEGS